MRKDLLTLNEVTVGYGEQTIIDNLTLTLEKGKSYTLIGHSGCGKTTLLYTLGGLIQPKNGGLNFESVTTASHVATVLQEYGLFPWKTVRENLSLGLIIKYKKLSSEMTASIEKLAIKLGLDTHLDKYPHQLSGGQKQRVAIGRAWLLSPELLLMDEPFSALDTITREALQNSVISLSSKQETTWVTVTHNIEEAVFLGREILLMSQTGGAITHRFDNPNFGDLELREKPEFYALCLQIRQAMKEIHLADGGAR